MKLVCFRIALASMTMAAATSFADAPTPGTSLALARDDSQQISPLKPASGEFMDLNKNGQKDPYEDPTLPIERRIDDLLSKMTVEEKTCQMATLYGYYRVLKDDLPKPEWKNAIWKDGIANIDEHLNGYQGGRGVDAEGEGASDRNPNVWPASAHAKAINEVQRWFIEQTRLGIPVDFSNEGIRGLAHLKATCFPSQNAMGATWDRKLVRRQGEITAIEGRALGYTNIYSPICDVSRDQRWGRNEDTYGEAPYLVGELAVQAVQGLQDNGVASTVKHYTIYSVTKGAREGQARVDPQVAPREADDVLVYPFKRAFRDGGAMGTMSSYNDYDGIPITGSHYWLTDKLRGEFGFRGYICSDSDAVEYLYTKHHVAADMKDAVRQVVEAGLNVRCTFTKPDVYIIPLRELIRDNKLSMSVIDSRVRDVLRVKYRLGLFDRPYVDPKKADELVMKPEHLAAALQASRESVVLLKNDPKDPVAKSEKGDKKPPALLPLNKALKKVLVCGPNADETQYALSRYGPFNVPVTTVLAGIKAKLQGTGTAVTYVKGCDTVDPGFPETEILPAPMNEKEKQGIADAVAATNGADVAIIVCGDGKKTTGEHKARTSLEIPGRQLDLIKAIHATGTPVVLVLINGRPHAINWPAANIPAIICANYPGAQGGTAIADVLFGDYNPGGKLTNTWPRSVGQIPYNFPAKPNSQWETDKAANVAGAIYYFGHGLSYTTFEYANLRIHPEQGEKFTTTANVIVEVDVKNTGPREGDEVAQLYHRDLVSSVTTYEMNLSGFERLTLKPGETKTARFVVVPEQLSLINRDNKRVVEPGDFKFMVGSSSKDIKLDKTIKLVE